jgi:hypothetical protein
MIRGRVRQIAADRDHAERDKHRHAQQAGRPARLVAARGGRGAQGLRPAGRLTEVELQARAAEFATRLVPLVAALTGHR